MGFWELLGKKTKITIKKSVTVQVQAVLTSCILCVVLFPLTNKRYRKGTAKMMKVIKTHKGGLSLYNA